MTIGFPVLYACQGSWCKFLAKWHKTTLNLYKGILFSNAFFSLSLDKSTHFNNSLGDTSVRNQNFCISIRVTSAFDQEWLTHCVVHDQLGISKYRMHEPDHNE